MRYYSGTSGHVRDSSRDVRRSRREGDILLKGAAGTGAAKNHLLSLARSSCFFSAAAFSAIVELFHLGGRRIGRGEHDAGLALERGTIPR